MCHIGTVLASLVSPVELLLADMCPYSCRSVAARLLCNLRNVCWPACTSLVEQVLVRAGH